jgi:AraC-like DNA-binding protein
MSVKEIAEAVGFNDVAYFCRAFKAEAGMTPLQYRKQN